MKKFIKIGIFSVILIFSITMILFKNDFNFGENVYVVSNSKEENKESTTNLDVNVSDKKSENVIKNQPKKMITIFVSGEVNKPGIVTLESGNRLADAVEKLDGPTKDAELNKVNMALKVEDEKHYIIPKIGEDIKSDEDIISNEDTNLSKMDKENENKNNKININTATVQELDTLPGIGEATANKIVQYRQENKSFKSLEEVKNVNGIGDKKFDNIKDFISVN